MKVICDKQGKKIAEYISTVPKEFNNYACLIIGKRFDDHGWQAIYKFHYKDMSLLKLNKEDRYWFFGGDSYFIKNVVPIMDTE